MSGTTTTSTYTPLYNVTKTILGTTNDLETTLSVTPRYDVKSTLNAKYQILATGIPAAGQHPIMRYFGIGIGGSRNVDGQNLSQPQAVSSLNMDIYTPIPFRCLPIEQDLSTADRAQYRIRTIITIGSQQYVCYYLKLITVDNTTVQYTKLNSTNNTQQAYTLDYSNLTPTAPTTSIDGSSNSVSSEIDVTVPTNFLVSGTEVQEAIQVLYNGDLRYARITEIGVYTGTDIQNTANDSNNNPFTYTESIMTQLAMHYTFNGVDMSSPTAAFNSVFSFGAGNITLI